jgi:hypothetical protein
VQAQRAHDADPEGVIPDSQRKVVSQRGQRVSHGPSTSSSSRHQLREIDGGELARAQRIPVGRPGDAAVG